MDSLSLGTVFWSLRGRESRRLSRSPGRPLRGRPRTNCPRAPQTGVQQVLPAPFGPPRARQLPRTSPWPRQVPCPAEHERGALPRAYAPLPHGSAACPEQADQLALHQPLTRRELAGNNCVSDDLDDLLPNGSGPAGYCYCRTEDMRTPVYLAPAPYHNTNPP